jgi:hypothetical protein
VIRCCRLLYILSLAVLAVGAMEAQSGSGAAVPSTANGGLLGSTVSWQYYAYGAPYGTPGTFEVTGGEGGNFGSVGDVDFAILRDNNSITFNYSVDNCNCPPWAASPLSLRLSKNAFAKIHSHLPPVRCRPLVY